MKKRRGIFIISVLFLAILAAMFASAAIAIVPSSFQRAEIVSQRLQAQRAVQSGVEYALARIRATPGGAWRGNPPAALTLESEGLRVREDMGKVEGWVKDGPSWSRFRMRFNWEDGPAGPDSMDNSNQPWSDLSYISLNNLLYNCEIGVPGLDSSGAVRPGSNRFNLAAHNLLLAVEGCSGPVRAGADGVPVGFFGSPAREKAEIILGLTPGGARQLDSLASSRGNMIFQVDQNQSIHFSKVGNSEARLRAKGSLSVTDASGAGGKLQSSLGEVRTLNGNSVGTTQLTPTVSQSAENSGDGFYNIPLASAPQASPQAVDLAGGVYEVDLINGQPQVTFYPMDYADYKSQRQAGTLPAGTITRLDSSIQLNLIARPGSTPMVEVRFTKDAKVSGSRENLAIVPAKGALQEGDAPLAGGGGAAAPSTFLADLANAIQRELPTAPTVVNGALATYNSPFLTSAGLTAVLAADSGGGNINTGGVDISYSASGEQITNVNNYGISWDGLPGIYNYQLGALELAQHFWVQSGSNPALATALSGYVGRGLPTGFGTGAPPDVGFGTDLDSASASGLGVKDLKITMQDTGSTGTGSVTLHANKDVVLGGMLEGRGGAIVSAGNVSLLGNGLDLTAAQSANSINLYSAGNILIDGFAFDDSSSAYNNLSLAGVMYAWGNITINAGKVGSSLARGRFTLRGAMVAFGGDPGQSNSSPDNITVTASKVDLVFDPSYLLNLDSSPVRSDSHFEVRAYHRAPW